MYIFVLCICMYMSVRLSSRCRFPVYFYHASTATCTVVERCRKLSVGIITQVMVAGQSCLTSLKTNEPAQTGYKR